MTDSRFLTLLRNWLSGNFRRPDEAELRSLATGDDFRREAWEGFQSQPETDHARHLDEVREQIRAKHFGGEGRIVQLPQRRWLAMAAALLLALVAVVFLPRIFEEKSASAGIAQHLDSYRDAPAADVPSASLPTTSAEKQAPEIRSQPQARDFLGKKASPVEAPKMAETAAEKPASPPASAIAQPTAPAKESPSADMVLNETKPAAAQPQSQQDGPPPSQGYKAKTRQSEAPAPASRAMDQAQTRMAAPNRANAEPQAFGGLDEFVAFANQYARLPKDARDNNISGFVRLRFSVSDEGKAYNFQIIRSLGYGCDEEAVRLAEGFLWEASRGQMVSVSVPFVR